MISIPEAIRLSVLLAASALAVTPALSAEPHILVDTKRRTTDEKWTPRVPTTMHHLPGFQPNQSGIETSLYGGRMDRRVAASPRPATSASRSSKIAGGLLIPKDACGTPLVAARYAPTRPLEARQRWRTATETLPVGLGILPDYLWITASTLVADRAFSLGSAANTLHYAIQFHAQIRQASRRGISEAGGE